MAFSQFAYTQALGVRTEGEASDGDIALRLYTNLNIGYDSRSFCGIITGAEEIGGRAGMGARTGDWR